MAIKICPNCGENYVVDPFVTDYEHRCRSLNKTVDEEDIVIIGNWEDFTGVGSRGATQVMWAGAESNDNEKITKRGARNSTHRSRQHYEYIK